MPISGANGPGLKSDPAAAAIPASSSVRYAMLRFITTEVLAFHTGQPVEKIKIGSEYGLQRLFEMFGGVFAVDRS